MGLLSLGTPLKWAETKKHCQHVREHGIIQLLNIWRTHKGRHGDKLLWGDEVEYMIVQLDNEKKISRLTLRQDDILDALISAGKGKIFSGVSFHQEYGRYMLEATPDHPYCGDCSDLLTVEANMKKRRVIAQEYLRDDEVPLTLTTYPLLGVGEFASPWDSGLRPVSESLFLPDNIINTHARFPTLTQNIRERRGEKVDIRIPLYQDTKTEGDEIYMDAMGFGMGSSCLQLTFQASDISEARQLYDQLVPFAPLMLALSAAGPLYRGHLSDQDVRWNVISASVDDRTRVERGLDPPAEDWAQHTSNTSPTIPKSRYDSVDCYLSESPILARHADFYNDVEVVTNTRAKKQLEDGGMDPVLAQHFSHLFIRDPLVIFEELLNQNDAESTDHFENLQSTNWQTIRFKPPPNGSIGWRVEFRSMDVQLTDEDNAAMAVFIVLLTRAILHYDLCIYTPISKVDTNMDTAHKRNAVCSEKFWFRTNIHDQTPETEPQFELLTLDQIFNGCCQYKGIIPLIQGYLDAMDVKGDTRERLEKYLSVVSNRASGKEWTSARWMRQFVLNHDDYKHDSIVSQKINYDLMRALQQVTDGESWTKICEQRQQS